MITQVNERDLCYYFTIHDRLRVIAKKLHKLDENYCNYGLTPRQEKAVDRLEKQAEEIAQDIGLHAYHQGDPRGCSLYLVKELGNDCQYTNGCSIGW